MVREEGWRVSRIGLPRWNHGNSASVNPELSHNGFPTCCIIPKVCGVDYLVNLTFRSTFCFVCTEGLLKIRVTNKNCCYECVVEGVVVVGFWLGMGDLSGLNKFYFILFFFDSFLLCVVDKGGHCDGWCKFRV